MAAKLDALSEHLDKILVSLGIGALLLVLAYVGMGLAKPLPDIEESTRVVQRKAQAVDMAPFSELLDGVSVVYDSNEGLAEDARILISEPRVRSVNSNELYYLIPVEAEVCPFTGTRQPNPNDRDDDQDTLPDVWEKEHGLSPEDPNDFYTDLDGDGFSNGEEYNAETSPSDSQDHPPMVSKLRVRKAVNRPYPFAFKGVTTMGEGKQVFSVKLSGSQTHFMKMNQEKNGWKPVKYEYRKKTAPGSPDESILVLENVKSGEQITLQVNKAGGGGERWLAEFILLSDPDWKKRVEKGSRFEVGGVPFEVLALATTQAKVKNTKTNQEHVISLATSLELMRMRGEEVPEMMGEGASGYLPDETMRGLMR